MKDPPAAESGEKYKTVDARCEACVVKGGTEAPCVNVAFYRETYSKECPRVELDEDNAEASDLVTMLADERMRSLAPALLDSWEMDPEDRQNVIWRARAALCDERVMAIMYPKHEDE